jgi:quinol monooxygenase YgiN
VHEEYTNISALKNHLNTAHFAKYNDFVQSKQPLEGIDVCFFHPREENEDTLTKKRPVHKDSFALNVNLYPKSNVRQEFLKVISNNKKGTDETEVLALQYTYGESIGIDVKAEGSEMTATIVEGSANTFHFHEQYTGENNGKEGFDAHATMPHFAAWEEFVGTDPFEKDPEVFFFKILE